MFYFIKTFGCQMNHSDSERLISLLEDQGFSLAPNMSEADLIIFNTCQVKQHAEDRVLGYFKTFETLRAIRPRLIGIMGCMTRITSTQLDSGDKKDFYLKRHEGFDFAIQTKDLPKLPKLLKDLAKDKNMEIDQKSSEFGKAYFDITPKSKNNFQVLVPISNGCNKFCAYCIVPFSRGQEIYRAPEDIVKEISKLIEKGAREVTLLGQNVNSYHPSCGTTFAGLLEKICETFPELRFIRFTSPYPTDFTDDLIKVLARFPQISRCLHMPLQSGSDKILKKMNRRYNQKEYLERVSRIKELLPDASFTTDIIVGFPGEEEEDFAETIKVYEAVRFELAYVSPYSPRRGTVASKLEDNVLKKEKTKRFNTLQKLQEKIAYENNQSYLGKTCEIIIENKDENFIYGRNLSYKYFRASFPKNKNLEIGDFAKARVLKAETWILESEFID